jgi:hypothetical protein
MEANCMDKVPLVEETRAFCPTSRWASIFAIVAIYGYATGPVFAATLMDRELPNRHSALSRNPEQYKP